LIHFSIFLGYLEYNDLLNLSVCNKKFNKIFSDRSIWLELLSHTNSTNRRQILNGIYERYGDDHGINMLPLLDLNTIKDITKKLYKLKKINIVKWHQGHFYDENELINNCDNNGRDYQAQIIDPMEAHCANAILNRFMVIIGGWSAAYNNDIYVVDCASINDNLNKFRSIPTNTFNMPRFKYGFSSVMLDFKTILLFGGCTQGGYSGQCTDLHIITLNFYSTQRDSTVIAMNNNEIQYSSSTMPTEDNDTDNYIDFIDAVYINPYEPRELPIHLNLRNNMDNLISYKWNSTYRDSYKPTPRGYHTCNLVTLTNKSLIFFGGLTGSGPTSCLEILDLRNGLWKKGITSGSEPSPRFGHTCVMDEEDRLIYTGGSNGSDLLRNGNEIKDVHILTIVRSTSINNVSSDQLLVWTTLKISYPQLLPGRCHNANIIGNKIIYFAGSAENTDYITVLDLKETINVSNDSDDELMEDGAIIENGNNQELKNYIYRPYVCKGNKPIVRCSSVGVTIGNHLIIFGGWNNQMRCLGDIWSVNLSISKGELDEFDVFKCNYWFQSHLNLNINSSDSDEDEISSNIKNNSSISSMVSPIIFIFSILKTNFIIIFFQG
jgi:hypothetical protein